MQIINYTFYLLLITACACSCSADLDSYSTRQRKNMIPYPETIGKYHGSASSTPDYLDVVHYHLDPNLVDRYEDYTSTERKILKNNGLVGRVVAKGGDVILIKDGLAFCNDRLVDADLDLKFLYDFTELLSDEDVAYITSLPSAKPVLTRDETNISMASLSRREYAQLASTVLSKKRSGGKVDIFDQHLTAGSRSWTHLNYGPLTVPSDHYFVLVDNRTNGSDSRTYGSIPKTAIRAVFEE